jgi:hypothetical protein
MIEGSGNHKKVATPEYHLKRAQETEARAKAAELRGDYRLAESLYESADKIRAIINGKVGR